eukprot:472205-Prorocentrum_lima.AAC.1
MSDYERRKRKRKRHASPDASPERRPIMEAASVLPEVMHVGDDPEDEVSYCRYCSKRIGGH